ncbi:uncharacterized protein [Aegilops tauschii subsp. strangulata]|uniref:uncharacterized protein isoform X4 n=1 Tax=Aegilops tauschii subsp. strangulata TaxID=200361 RepID=UPI003CC84F51
MVWMGLGSYNDGNRGDKHHFATSPNCVAELKFRDSSSFTTDGVACKLDVLIVLLALIGVYAMKLRFLRLMMFIEGCEVQLSK